MAGLCEYGMDSLSVMRTALPFWIWEFPHTWSINQHWTVIIIPLHHYNTQVLYGYTYKHTCSLRHTHKSMCMHTHPQFFFSPFVVLCWHITIMLISDTNISQQFVFINKQMQHRQVQGEGGFWASPRVWLADHWTVCTPPRFGLSLFRHRPLLVYK